MSNTEPMTTSTHVGPRVVQGHNVRDPKYVAKEKHIDPDGISEIWAHEDIKDAYKRIFDDAVKAYNKQQTDSRRIIEDYLQKVKKSKQQHPCYEMIVTIGNKDNQPSFEVSRDILKEYSDSWNVRNPNLFLAGIYFHADEPGANHIHVDFIPIAYNNTRGLSVQNSMSKALKEMGFSNKNNRYSETESIQWINRERDYLDSLCRKRGLVIHHPNAGKGTKHLEKEQYILTQKVAELTKQEKEQNSITNNLKAQNEAFKRKAEKAKAEINAQFDKLNKEYRFILSQKDSCQDEVEVLEKRLKQIKKHDKHISAATDFYDAFLKLSIEKEFDAEFQKIHKLIEEKIAYEKVVFQNISQDSQNPAYTDINTKNDPLSIDYEY